MRLALSSLSPFSSVWACSLQNTTTGIYCGSSHLDQPHLDNSSQTSPEFCFYGGSKSHQVVNQDQQLQSTSSEQNPAHRPEEMIRAWRISSPGTGCCTVQIPSREKWADCREPKSMYSVVKDQEMRSHSDTGNRRPSLACLAPKAERRSVHTEVFLGKQPHRDQWHPVA